MSFRNTKIQELNEIAQLQDIHCKKKALMIKDIDKSLELLEIKLRKNKYGY